MATWKFGPIKCQEDWGLEYKDAEYQVEYGTVSDYLAVDRIFEGKTERLMSLGYDPAIEVTKLMAQWLVNYHGYTEDLQALIDAKRGFSLEAELEEANRQLNIERAENARLHAIIKRRGI